MDIRAAAELHQTADVGKVNINQARFCDQLGDPLDGLAKHIIRKVEGYFHRQVLWRNIQQPVVWDRDQGVGMPL
jgi:hypothetical protein